jgi:ribosomal protein S18 acetylase RimI-like enzyme
MLPESLCAPIAGIGLRDALPGDEAFLRGLYRGVRDAELALTNWSDAQKDAFADSQFALQDRWYRGQYPGARFLVVLRGAVAVGRIYLYLVPGELRLMEITLAPEARNAGLGTSLVQWVQELARERGAAVTLHVEQSNPARALYARLGFGDDGQEGIYARMRWEPDATPG